MVKRCKDCQEEKELSEFYKLSRSYKGKTYYRNSCKKCVHKHMYSYGKDYKKKYREKVNKNARNYWKKRHSDETIKTKINEGQRNRYHRYVFNRLFKNAEKRAKENNIEFSITLEDISIPAKCPLLGITIFTGNKYDYNNSPSLDRIDNSKGYTKENIWVISMLANTMKNKASIEQLVTFSKNILSKFNSNEIVQTIENKKSIEQ